MLRILFFAWGLFFLSAVILSDERTLPIVSATQLDPLSLKEIAEKYPKGFCIDYLCLSKELLLKIKQLNEWGLTVQPTDNNTRELQTLTGIGLKSLDVSVFFQR